MSLSVYPIFANDNFRQPYEINGDEILNHIDFLDEICSEKHVRLLSDFDGRFSDFPDDFDGNPWDLQLPEEEWNWHHPIDCLNTIQAILEGINDIDKNDRQELDELIVELQQLSACLKHASDEGIEFILAIG